MAILWHPDAERRPVFGRPGKPWSGGQGNPKYLFHTTEITTRWPNYLHPPHVTLNPWTGELRQHVPFNLAAYAIRSSRVDAMEFAYQVEHWGKAKVVPFYPDVWYSNVAKLIQWFHDNLDVPIVFDDFTNLRFGAFGSRLPYADVDKFAGIIGHGRIGRGIDTHWDPGALDVPRLEAMLDNPAPPPPPSNMEDAMWPLKLDDGKPGTGRAYKADDVMAVQKRLRRLGHSLKTDGICGPITIRICGDEVGLELTDEIDGVAGERLGSTSILKLAPKGQEGEQGVQGEQGPQGVKGDPGEGISTGDELTVTVN